MTHRARPNCSRKMIFITGASRSGTTLMSFILRNHSLVFGLRELHYFGDAWDPRQPGRVPGERGLAAAAARIYARQENGILSLSPPGPEHLKRAHALLESLQPAERDPANVFAAASRDLAARAGKEIPCEQTPRNIFYAEALLRAYPNARVIHMMRDPRAVMASQKRRWRRRQLSTDRKGYPLYHTVRERINYHPYTTMKLWSQASREARRLSLHPRFSIARFEDLVNDPEDTVRQVCRALELDFQPAMLDVQQINSSHQSSAGGARRGIHRDALDAWRTTLSQMEIVIAERLCKAPMVEQGYQPIAANHARSAGEIPYLVSYVLHLAGVAAINPRRAWIQARAVLGMPGGRTTQAAK